MSLEALAFIAALIVVDGDTVKHAPSGERLRLGAIDAPEMGGRSKCLGEWVLAIQASERVRSLLPRVVRIEDSGKVGGYDRRLVTLRLDDGRSVGDVLISSGLAVKWAGRRHDWCSLKLPLPE